MFDVLDGYDGSISAEHGVGLAKRDAFVQRIDPVALSLARGLKHLLDPSAILSRGRILPAAPDATPSASPLDADRGPSV